MKSKEIRPADIAPAKIITQESKPHMPAPGTSSRAYRRMQNTFGSLALVTAGIAGSGCSLMPDAENQSDLAAENKQLTEDLGRCHDLKDMAEGGSISMGTLGVRRLDPDRLNEFIVPKLLIKIDQVFTLWPAPESAEWLTIEGAPNKLNAVKMGSYWAVEFKSDYTQGEESKDTFVIQNGYVAPNEESDPRNPGIQRYVVKIVRR